MHKVTPDISPVVSVPHSEWPNRPNRNIREYVAKELHFVKLTLNFTKL